MSHPAASRSRVVSLSALALCSLPALLAGACSPPAQGPECTYNSDCSSPFVCLGGSCVPECKTSADCTNGYDCINAECQKKGGGNGNGCVYNSDCTAPLKCLGGTCAPECIQDIDCVAGYLCVDSQCKSGGGAGGAGAGPGSGGSSGGGSGGSGGSTTTTGGGGAGCMDGVQNGSETGVDCGGSCAPCPPGGGCQTGADCASGKCLGGICQAPTCSDGVENGSETDIDCGGPACNKCGVGVGCSVASDCLTGICAGGVCQAPSCVDGIKNGAETDIDCGGASCPKCDNTKNCQVSSDCVSGLCAAGVCQMPSCMDGIENGGETDIDCGGGACAACGVGKGCTASSDCTTGICLGGICQAPSCMDGIKNGAETDVDCGGAACPTCADGKVCLASADCASGTCLQDVCASTYTLSVIPGGAGNGTVTSVPAGINCGAVCTGSFPAGSQVTLSASAGAGSTFTGWSGGGCSGTGACTVTMNGMQSVVATFDAQATGALAWEKVFGGGGASTATNDVAFDASGNVLVTGYFIGTIDFGGGPLTVAGYGGWPDIVVAKFSASGAHVWSRRFGSAHGYGDYPEYGKVVAADGNGDVLMAANSAGSTTTVSLGGALLGCDYAAVAKYAAANGAHLWSKCLATGGSTTVEKGAIDASGNIVLTGTANGADFGGGPLSGTFLVKLSGVDGSHIWSKSLPSFGIGDLAIDAAGNIAVSGYFQGSLNLGGSALASLGSYDAAVARFGPTGQHLWSKSFGDSFDDRGEGVAFDGNGNVLLTGRYQGTIDFGAGPVTSAGGTDGFVLELAAVSGAHQWSKQFGGPNAEYGTAVAVSPDGTPIIAGQSAAGTDFGNGPLMAGGVFGAKYDPQGAFLWLTTRGAGTAYAIAIDTSGSSVIGGILGNQMSITKLLP